jgi:SAM-dependent methyltransferase
MNADLEAFSYSGNELKNFAAAVNWKAYWSRQIEPYLGQDVLELGAGIGATARALNHRSYRNWLGLEPDKAMCELIESDLDQGDLPSSYQIRHGTSTSLNGDERFDTILYIDVLEHIEHDREELERVTGHLADGGHIVIVAPAHNFLFTSFDKKIGHHRRYDKGLLSAIVPANLRIRKMHYLDSVGMLASLGNKLILKSDTPKLAQIKLWDSVMVRASRWVDPLTGHQIGKSIVCILQKKPDNALTRP